MASRRVTVERVAGGSYIIGRTVHISCGRRCVAVGATLHVAVVVGEDTTVGRIIVTFLAVVVKKGSGCKQSRLSAIDSDVRHR